ncbi:hypothetical protein EYW98_07720 [Escherichia coli]|nr:hypothetical protein [Escherichia sp. MOD1-EC7003]EGO8359384.1 hypothetical protein [Escherichia coli]EGO8377724.1 hypothetical protein [Escherichia coli]MCH0694235.1 hypothetical protein [Escherichia coli]
MPLIIIAAGVALLLILMIGFKVNGFIALLLEQYFRCRYPGHPDGYRRRL